MMLNIQMRISLLFFLLLIVMLVALPAKAEQKLSVDSQLFDAKQAGRIILVTYADKHINRIPIGAADQTYRQRGSYSSSTWSKRVAASIGGDYKIKVLSQWPIKEIGEHCVVFLVSEDQSIVEVINALRNDSRIDNVQTMSTFKVMASKYNDPYYRFQTNIHSMDLAKIHSQVTGKNVTIAIIDTGVDATHPDLEGQIRQSKDFVAQKSSDSFGDNHGTAIAGVIAAKANNGQGIVGIAPDSHLIALKACWGIKAGGLEAICNSFTLALAINAAIEMKVDILNLSLTGPHDPLLSRLIEKAIQRGIFIIASQPDSEDEKSGFPAQEPGVIGVRSLSDSDIHLSPEDHILVVSAPGEDILTTLPKGTYDFVSGSSLAAAHVSGLAALLLQLKHSLTKQELFNLLAKANEPAFDALFSKGPQSNIGKIRSKADKRI
ncbi:S8 family serine peptidase [Nitrosomonas sp.]|uniref:S8 family peptidase n=1 Tax=Nitrosomonas sp. TaxID=42353 RepID=UPI0025D703F6|nr:S8 family serine peptidase [Nitrosomonas sp.]MBY0484890.1 S8 family serine peptidase [Nitrosomonas sp.]